MRYFPIKELERLSGVKAHTIRIWEARYQVLSPLRRPSNIRYYTVNDLERLLNIVFLLNKEGYKISKLAILSKQQLEREVQQFFSGEDKDILFIDKLLICMLREDIDTFETLIDRHIQAVGIDKTIHSVIIPFLERSGILSFNNNSTEICFAINVLRRKIILGIESLDLRENNSDRALLFLFKDEQYDLILLYINYILKVAGIHVFYLGANISPANLEKVIIGKRPNMMFSYITSKQLDVSSYYRIMQSHIPDTKLYIFHPHNNFKVKSDLNNVVFLDLNQIDSIKEL